MDPNRTLVICRSIKELRVLERFIQGNVNAGIILASDSLQVQKEAREKYHIESKFIDQSISVYEVGNDVLEIRTLINKWLAKFTPSLPDFVVKWEKWAEGGMTTQTIQNILILVRSYQLLLKENNIDHVIFCSSKKYSLEISVLIEVLKSNGIQFRKVYSGILNRVFTGRGMALANVRVLNKCHSLYVPSVAFWAFKNGLLIFRIFITKLTAPSENIDKKKNLVIFLLNSSAQKHIDNITIVMQELRQYDNIIASAICWNTKRGNKIIRERGYNSVSLESFIVFNDILNTIKLLLNAKKYLGENKKSLINDYDISYEGVLIGGILLPFIYRFINVEFPSRLLLYFSSQNYLKQNKPKAIKSWGDNILFLGLVFYELTRKKNQLSRPFLFFYSMGLSLPNPYDKNNRLSDFNFVSGDMESKVVVGNQNNIDTAVIPVGSVLSSKAEMFFQNFTVEDSKEILNLRENFDYNLFFVSSSIMPGYIGEREQSVVASALFDFVRVHKNISILIKPHPSEDENSWFNILEKYNFPQNIFLFDKKTNPYHCINVSDIIITKYSTLAIESMYFNKPVISIVLGNDKFQDVFDEGVEKFTGLEKMLNQLDQIINDKSYFMRWEKNRILAQREYLTKKFIVKDLPAEKIIANTIANKIIQENAE